MTQNGCKMKHAIKRKLKPDTHTWIWCSRFKRCFSYLLAFGKVHAHLIILSSLSFLPTVILCFCMSYSFSQLFEWKTKSIKNKNSNINSSKILLEIITKSARVVWRLEHWRTLGSNSCFAMKFTRWPWHHARAWPKWAIELNGMLLFPIFPDSNPPLCSFLITIFIL